MPATSSVAMCPLLDLKWRHMLRDSGPCAVENKSYDSSSPNGLLCMAQGQHSGIDPLFHPHPIADRMRPYESSFHTWDRPTKMHVFYNTGA